MDYEVSNFEYDVLERSNEVPVVVDFWAPWCGPCRTLGPTIEKLAAEAQGAWELVKVNVDEHPDVSQAFRIRGIPAVKMFSKGNVVGEFTGALPEQQIRQWLKTYIPSDLDNGVVAAEHLFTNGQFADAQGILEKVLAADPKHPQAAFILAKIILFEQPEQAEALLHIALSEPKNMIFIESMQKMVKILLLQQQHAEMEDAPIKQAFLDGLAALSGRDFPQALEKFISVVAVNREYHHGLAKDACIAIFHYLGEQHDITKQYRRKFSMALY